MIRHFLNLSNGLEFAPDLKVSWGLVRIQSTWCEQKRWWPIIQDLDYTFLLALASGEPVFVYDTSAQKDTSRAIYQGLEWVKYACNRVWFDNTTVPIVRGNDCSSYFAECWKEKTEPAIRKLRYCKKFVLSSGISLSTVCRRSIFDGKYDRLRSFL